MAYNPIRCHICKVLRCKTVNCIEKEPVFKRIDGQVQQPSSLRMIRLGASQVGIYYCDSCAGLEWNQSSDRKLPGGRGIPMGMKLGRPGSGVTQPINSGIDITHNSYQRRIRKLQAKVLSN